MPPFGMHMTLARELGPQLGHRAALDHPGAYYLGATAPDIRAMTGWDRSRTHFFDLDDFEDQHSVARLFEAHEELAQHSALADATVAFLLGYISHLEMDETWICDVYRPCFGEHSPLQGEQLLANLLDRTLQFELDQRGRCDAQAVGDIRRALMEYSQVDVETDLVDRETLARWREVLVDVLGRSLDWERFRKNIPRHLRPFGVESEEDVAHLLRNLPDLVDQSIREVTPERLAAFQERSRQRALEAIREYLG